MLSETGFVEQVRDAYEHLYDLVCLRTHPLTDMLTSDPHLRLKEKAWQLHHILLNIIEELDPGPGAPVFSREWRRHRLMVLHYLEGLDPQAVADELGISRRHYYREHEAALEAVASILWNRYSTPAPTYEQVSPAAEEEITPDHLELLRLEAARVSQASRYTDVVDVIQGISSLLQEMLQQRKLELELAIPETLPSVLMDRALLRQLLLGIMGYLVEHTNHATLRLGAQVEGSAVRLSIMVDPSSAVQPASQPRSQDRLADFAEMAILTGTQLLPVQEAQSVVGFEVALPTSQQRTVLVVDDNEDVLELFQRYLSSHHCRAVTTQTAQDALDLACRLQPYAITLDLMMPDQDGWDLLQTLLNRPDTQHIPVIVCSVLKQKDLALSLGATAFLEKPVSEQVLLSTLQALEESGESDSR